MRILTGEEFMKEPYGTVYITFLHTDYRGQPKIKSEARGEEFGNTWWATTVLPWLVDDVFYDIKQEIETEGFCTDDAVYNHESNMLYAVFNKAEVADMISRLQEALEILKEIE